jgi:hypothetical protein
LSHQRGKNPPKTKNQNKQKQNKTKYPKFNAIQFQLDFQHAVLVQSLSHQRKRKKKRKRVWRQFRECLSGTAAHLPTTISQLLLEALLIADLRSELSTHLALQALFV